MLRTNLKKQTLPAVFHCLLPNRIRYWLQSKGISNNVINENLLGWYRPLDALTIPIYDKAKNFLFFKYRRNPLIDNSEIPKYWYDKGVKSTLYGSHFNPTNNSSFVVFCEGELDALVLISNNIPSITSTGGAGSFSKQWLDYLDKFKTVFICFDNDEAGNKGSLKLHKKIANSVIVKLPPEVGVKGDISDYFSKLHNTSSDFINLLKFHKENNKITFVQEPDNKTQPKTIIPHHNDNNLLEKARQVPILQVAEALGLKIKHRNNPTMTLCPFHNDTKPSLALYPSTNSFYCFGCMKVGDSIDLVRQIKGYSLKEAIDYILGT